MLEQLEGYSVAITADRRAREQAELLERRGAQVVMAPGIRTLAISEEDATRRATLELFERPPDYVVANTAIGIRGWVGAAEAWGWDERLLAVLHQAEVLARGPKAAGAVTQLGAAVAWKAPTETLRELVQHLLARPLAGKRIAFQQHGEDGAEVTAPLRAAGADVVEVPVYRWTLPSDLAPLHRLLHAVAERRVDAVTFTSAPVVQNVFEVVDAAGLARIRSVLDRGHVLPVAVGPVTEAALRDHGVGHVVAPQLGRLGAMVRVLAEALSAKRLHLPGGVVVQGAAVASSGHRSTLTDKERALLGVLAEQPGAVVSRQRLCGIGDERALEASVHRLRRKLGPGAAAVATVAKRGYRLNLTARVAAG